MPAHRKYSDAQRECLLRLHAAGMTSAQISEACEHGTAGTEPFSIPRRTVSAIVRAMLDEADMRPPTSVLELESQKTLDRFPVRIARIVDAEINRLQSKQERNVASAATTSTA